MNDEKVNNSGRERPQKAFTSFGKVLSRVWKYSVIVLILVLLVALCVRLIDQYCNHIEKEIEAITSIDGDHIVVFNTVGKGFLNNPRNVKIIVYDTEKYQNIKKVWAANTYFNTSIDNDSHPITKDNWEVKWLEDDLVEIVLKGKGQSAKKFTFKRTGGGNATN